MFDSAAAGMSLNEQQLNHTTGVKTQVHLVQENNKQRENRPVEASEEGAKAKMEGEGNTRTETVIDENNAVVVKTYNEEGELINMVPPGYVPLSERL